MSEYQSDVFSDVEMFMDVIASAQKPEMLVFSFSIQMALKIFCYGLVYFI